MQRRVTIERIVAVGVPAILLGVFAWHRRWITDDALINSRIIQNLLDGNGLVYNVGERVEAGTSFLWLFLIAGLHALPGAPSIEWTMVLTGLIFSVAAVIVAQHTSLRIWASEGKWVFPFGALIFVALPPVWDFATSGLETSLSFLWLAVAWATISAAILRNPTARGWRAGAVVSLGPLVRPDLGVFWFVFAVVLLMLSSGRRNRIGIAIGLVAIPLVTELFRMGYFAAIVPNTAIAKSASSSDLIVGWHYLVDFARPYLLIIPAVLIIALVWLKARTNESFPNRARKILLLAPLLGGVINGAYFTAIGGDYMHARLLLPATFAMLLPVMAVPVKGRQWIPAGLVLGWAVLCVIGLRPPYAYLDGNNSISDERAFWLRANYVHGNTSGRLITVEDHNTPVLTAGLASGMDPENIGRLHIKTGGDGGDGYWIQAADPKRTFWTADALGEVGRLLPNAHMIDLHGLADPLGSRLPTDPNHRQGHGKNTENVWVLARYGAPQSADSKDLLDARRALTCGETKQMLDAVTKPLTIKLFAHNVIHAYSYTKLQISDVPAVAVKTCS